jgi:hypothetical protein
MPNQERRDENPLDKKRKTREVDDVTRTAGLEPKQEPKKGGPPPPKKTRPESPPD